VTLVDIVEGMPQGKALDMQQAVPLWHAGGGSRDRTTSPRSRLGRRGDDRGIPAQARHARSDLLKANADIIRPAADAVKEERPNAYVVVVTNRSTSWRTCSGSCRDSPKSRVMGMAGILDSARFRAFIAMELGVSGADVQAMVLGGHGDSMVPLPRFTTVGGIAVTELIPKDRLDAIIQRTRDGGAEIVKLLKTGSAYYAPAMSAVEMVQALLTDQKRMVPCSVLLEGQYGLKDLFIGVPVILGAQGVEKIIELRLASEELAALQKSGKDVADMIASFPSASDAGLPNDRAARVLPGGAIVCGRPTPQRFSDSPWSCPRSVCPRSCQAATRRRVGRSRPA